MSQNYTLGQRAQQIQPDWDFYFCEVDQKPAIISVDLNVAEDAPHTATPYMFFVSIKVIKTDKEGYPVPSELGKLCKLEDRLLEILRNDTEIRFCGRVTTNGCRDLIFYVSDPKKAEQSIVYWTKSFPEYRIEKGWKEDAEWDTYFNFLFPNEIELNTIFNQRVVAQLEQEGDILEAERKITHNSLFYSVEDRDNFILFAIDNHFRVESVNRDNAKEHFCWTVKVSRYDFINIEKINELTSSMLEATKHNNGLYDGWETIKEK